MDRTITRTGTYSGFLLALVRLRVWRLIFLPLVLLAVLAYAARLVGRGRLKEWTLGLLAGRRLSGPDFDRLVERYAARTLARNSHGGALRQIAADRAAGYRVVLATASFHLYVDAIARQLAIDDVLATRLRPGTTRLAGANCYGAAKAARVEEWFADAGIDPAACHIRAYSDHISDLPLLAMADEPVAANPSPRLAAAARARGWPVVYWN